MTSSFRKPNSALYRATSVMPLPKSRAIQACSAPFRFRAEQFCVIAISGEQGRRRLRLVNSVLGAESRVASHNFFFVFLAEKFSSYPILWASLTIRDLHGAGPA